MRTARTTPVGTLYGVRGGPSLTSVLSGMFVAFGVMFVLTAIIGGAIAGTTGNVNNLARNEAIRIGIGGGIAFMVAQFLSYMWGGYSAGRMARGMGALNGLLVALVGLIVGAGVAFGASYLAGAANWRMPFTATRIPISQNVLVQYGIGFGAAMLAAMFLGAIAGGVRGAHWHDRLEATDAGSAVAGATHAVDDRPAAHARGGDDPPATARAAGSIARRGHRRARASRSFPSPPVAHVETAGDTDGRPDRRPSRFARGVAKLPALQVLTADGAHEGAVRPGHDHRGDVVVLDVVRHLLDGHMRPKRGRPRGHLSLDLRIRRRCERLPAEDAEHHIFIVEDDRDVPT
jgi:hypothetical protein